MVNISSYSESTYPPHIQMNLLGLPTDAFIDDRYMPPVYLSRNPTLMQSIREKIANFLNV
jgi:hypothetical protein